MAVEHSGAPRKPFRWHIAVFLAPAVAVYTAIMIIPLASTLYQSFFSREWAFVGFDNFVTLFTDPRFSQSFWNALSNNVWFFIIHMLVQNPIGILLARCSPTRGCGCAASTARCSSSRRSSAS
jgi:raffinose/stachyose/melibiose transport system permease protein